LSESLRQLLPGRRIGGGFSIKPDAYLAEMLGALFSNSNGQQQAGILNHLLNAVGSSAASGILGIALGAGSLALIMAHIPRNS
jgi:hypothetical protein